jgi:uncharacterized protein (TIGR03382 family)
MKRLLSIAAVAACFAVASGTASATYTAFSGIDENGDPTTPLVNIPNSSGAEALFKMNVSAGVATEDFESKVLGTTGPLELTFVDSVNGTTAKATLDGGSGRVAATDSSGRYSIPSDSSSQFWLVDAADSANAFTLKFDTAIAAFGFYGMDIGDFGGALEIDLLDGLGNVLHTESVPTSSSDGSAIYFGLLAGATDGSEDFAGVRFRSSASRADAFAFDNFTLATRAQLCNPAETSCGPIDPGTPVPVPGTLALAGLGLLAAGLRKRRI